MVMPGRLTAAEREYFTEIVEWSLRVGARPQYFSWLQGIVQTLMPHEIAIGGAEAGAWSSLPLDYLSSTLAFRDEHFRDTCLDGHGVVARLIEEWKSSDAPCIVAAGFEPDGRRSSLSELEATGLRNIAIHGVRGPGGRLLGLYAFACIPAEAVSGRLAYLLELLVPYVHGTFLRVLVNESRARGARDGPAARPITAREMEILTWIKEGKTNADIAGILDLSPWTVKNHVQTVLRKLGAQTRSHAVARAMSMGLL
jgi:transcriptional regulator EpsA